METFDFKNEYIFFLRHPEKSDHYLIMQEYESVVYNRLAQFNREGKYENGPVTMPHNRVSLIEKIPVPDKSLFGLCYFICYETGEFTYEEDGRLPYAEWGWWVLKDSLQTSKWLQQYMGKKNEKISAEKDMQKGKASQIRMF